MPILVCSALRYKTTHLLFRNTCIANSTAHTWLNWPPRSRATATALATHKPKPTWCSWTCKRQDQLFRPRCAGDHGHSGRATHWNARGRKGLILMACLYQQR
jgi:hypothetical protein